MKSPGEQNPFAPPSKELERQEHWERIYPYVRAVSGLESRSGDERLVREYLMKEAEALGIETKTDQAGNLWLLSEAPESGILLCSHMDKVGKARAAVVSGEQVIGRLDDALGASIIMGALKKGHRPSVLFTVEEEAGGYGSHFATHLMVNGKAKRPKLALIMDVSALEKSGAGPLMYVSSGRVSFPQAPIESVKKILERNGKRATFLDGWPNDSIKFAMMPASKGKDGKEKPQAVLTLQVHVDHMHTEKETASRADVEEVASVLETILTNHGELPE